MASIVSPPLKGLATKQQLIAVATATLSALNEKVNTTDFLSITKSVIDSIDEKVNTVDFLGVTKDIMDTLDEKVNTIDFLGVTKDIIDSIKEISLPSTTLLLGGPVGAAPTVVGLDYQLYARRYATGTKNSGVNLSLINVEGDSATITGPSFLNAFTVQNAGFGGSTVQGGRQAIQASVNQTAATSVNNANRNYVGIYAAASSSSGDGGTDLSGGSNTKGGYFGINPCAFLYSGATNVLNVSTGEFNIAVQQGASVYYKSGIQIAALGSDAVQGTGIDAMISLSSQGGPGWRDCILIGSQNGASPLTTDTSIVRVLGGAIKHGIDLSGVASISGSLIKGPSGSIGDSGTALRLLQNDGIFINMTSGSSTQKGLSLIGRPNLSPYWVSADDFVIRSSGTGVIDLPGTVTSATLTSNAYLNIKIGGTAYRLLLG